MLGSILLNSESTLEHFVTTWHEKLNPSSYDRPAENNCHVPILPGTEAPIPVSHALHLHLHVERVLGLCDRSGLGRYVISGLPQLRHLEGENDENGLFFVRSTVGPLFKW